MDGEGDVGYNECVDGVCKFGTCLGEEKPCGICCACMGSCALFEPDPLRGYPREDES